VEKLLKNLLTASRITWIPHPHAPKENNPLAILMDKAKTRSSALSAASIIMDYCVIHANTSRNLAFLAPLFGALSQVMKLFPDEALERLSQATFIPVMNRPYVLNNHIIAYPPSFRFNFWEPCKTPLFEMKKPIIQLYVSPDKPHPDIDNFRPPLFMVSFDQLWHYRDLEKPTGTDLDVQSEASISSKMTNWYLTLYHMIRIKTRLRSHKYVECYEFSLDFYDNPAVAALVAYKW
jgi:hypothetical protein